MGNRSLWKVGRNLYNKSLVGLARERCLQLPEAAGCVNINLAPEGGEILTPKRATCLRFECAECAPTTYATYFGCAKDCSNDLEDPSSDCIDCSYSFDDRYDAIDALRERMFEAYFAGMFGFHLCPYCSFYEQGMMDADTGMTEECRRCHYAIEDFINNDIFSCFDELSGTGASMRCFSTVRGAYNFEQDFYGILKASARSIDLTLAGNEADRNEYTYDPA